MRFIHTADTHLGFEITKNPAGDQEGRRKRAALIAENFQAVADRALETGADLFIHGGDLFNKHDLPRPMLEYWVRPLLELGRAGIPTVVIPGNHERSAFPFDLFHGSKNVIVFDRPRTVVLNAGGYRLGVAGFPFIRERSRFLFFKALEETEYRGLGADLHFLATHQAFDQAVVGPSEWVFRSGRSDTVERRSLPMDFEYIAAGHIHRHQVLDHPGRPGIRFGYPGSVQRMSFAEQHEEKGYLEGEVSGNHVHLRFRPLPAWSLEKVDIPASGMTPRELEEGVYRQSWRAADDLIIRFCLIGGERREDYPAADFDRLRSVFGEALEVQFALQIKGRWVFR